MDFKELNKKFSTRLNNLMIEYNLNYVMIAKNTGYTRQTITNYLTNRAQVNFDFLQKYYLYLNSLEPMQNLNFEYFVNPSCNIKTKVTADNLSNIGISQKAITNIFNIVSNPSDSKFTFDLFSDGNNKLNFKKLFFLNALLESNHLDKFLESMIDLHDNSTKQSDIDFLNWKIENAMKEISKDVAIQILENKQ